MKKNMRVIVNGKPYEIEIDDLTKNPATVLVNGVPYQVELESAEKPHDVSLVEVPVPAESNPANGSSAKVSAAAAAGANALTAPMPGVVMDITVKAGDKVTRGQQLCALEAMKMKSAIRSPKDGVIASVDVVEGARVSHGAVLFRYE
jgi:glutaconyl-CoA/methylmalonyl-CoA decarboxylase subunit gamma